MMLVMRDQENVEKGKEYGEERMLSLIQKLLADKRFAEIERMKDDKDYRLILYREYQIIWEQDIIGQSIYKCSALFDRIIQSYFSYLRLLWRTIS